MDSEVRVGAVTLLRDVTPGDWIAGSCGPFEGTLVSLLPPTFESYARVLHPAFISSTGGIAAEVRWADIEAANQRVATPEWTGQP